MQPSRVLNHRNDKIPKHLAPVPEGVYKQHQVSVRKTTRSPPARFSSHHHPQIARHPPTLKPTRTLPPTRLFNVAPTTCAG